MSEHPGTFIPNLVSGITESAVTFRRRYTDIKVDYLFLSSWYADIVMLFFFFHFSTHMPARQSLVSHTPEDKQVFWECKAGDLSCGTHRWWLDKIWSDIVSQFTNSSGYAESNIELQLRLDFSAEAWRAKWCKPVIITFMPGKPRLWVVTWVKTPKIQGGTTSDLTNSVQNLSLMVQSCRSS